MFIYKNNMLIKFEIRGRLGNAIFRYLACTIMCLYYNYKYTINDNINEKKTIMIDDKLFFEIFICNLQQQKLKLDYDVSIIMNGFYQHLIERLSWLENRHTTLGESNIIKNISCGIIATGQNFNGSNVIELQKEVLKFFGFNVEDSLCWNWQYTKNPNDETQESYKKSSDKFNDTFGLD